MDLSELSTVLVVLLVLMVVGNPGHESKGEVTEVRIETQDSVTPQQPLTASPVTSTPTSSERSLNGIHVRNLSREESRRLNESMSHFFERLPRNQTERTIVAAGVAQNTCRDLAQIDPTIFTTTSSIDRQTYRLSHAARTLNTEYTDAVQPAGVERVLDASGDIAKYTTVVGAYNEFYKAACAFDRTNPETVKQFYLSSAALGFELMMMQYGAYYQVSSKATRVASHTSTFRAVQTTVGDDALRILMSETHWLVRGSINGAGVYVSQTATGLDIDLNETTVNNSIIEKHLETVHNTEIKDDLEEVVGESGFDRTVTCLQQEAEEGGALGTIARKLPRILADQKVESRELTFLSSRQKERLKSCLE